MSSNEPHGPASYTQAAVDAFEAAAGNESDMGGFVAEVLARTASRLGPDLDWQLYGRPGGWEAALVGRLLDGTPPGLYDDQERGRTDVD